MRVTTLRAHICDKCGKLIPKGSQCQYSPTPLTLMGYLIYHTTCYWIKARAVKEA